MRYAKDAEDSTEDIAGFPANDLPRKEIMNSKRESGAYKGTTRDIRYADITGVDPNLLSLDVYVPESGESLPVMVWFHGGGWAQGDKQPQNLKPPTFNGHGFVYITANYRLTPRAVFPAHAEDVSAAIAWAKRNIAEYRGDPSRIFIGGHSAGAHLVALVATDGYYLEKVSLSLRDIKGVVVLDTQIFDIKSLVKYTGGRLGGVYTNVFGATDEKWDMASPVAHIRPGKNIPPMLVAHSGGMPGAAERSRTEENARFVRLLKEAGVDAELVPATDKTHLEINQDLGKEGDMVTGKVFDFLERCLK